jgi:hypothetical protein
LSRISIVCHPIAASSSSSELVVPQSKDNLKPVESVRAVLFGTVKVSRLGRLLTTTRSNPG